MRDEVMRTIGTLLCLMAAIVVVSMQISRFANEQSPVNLADEVDESDPKPSTFRNGKGVR